MARGATLAKLLTLLKGEIGQVLSSDTAPGNDALLKSKLEVQQRFLAAKYPWPFLDVRPEITLVPGTRYYDYPTRTDTDSAAVENPSLEHDIVVETKWGNLWSEVRHGIGRQQLNYVDSDRGVRLDPVRYWQFYDAGDNQPAKIEVWPIPNTAGVLRLRGQRSLNPLVDDADTAELDDLLIVLFTAAEMLALLGQGDAQAKLARAQDRLNQIRGKLPVENKTFMLGAGGRGSGRKTEQHPTVAVNYTP